MKLFSEGDFIIARLNGHKGLLVAIVAEAKKDANSKEKKRRQSALKFFAGNWYQSIMECLGLPGSWLPAGVTREDVKPFYE